MNETFAKSKNIILDEKYSLQPDQFNGLVLTFSETRKRTKKDGTEEDFVFSDKWYFLKLSQTLRKYFQLKQMEAGSLEELLSKVESVEKIIEKLK